MRFSAGVCLAVALVLPRLVAQSIEPGTGAPNEYVRNLFVNAFNRGSFARIAALPPTGPVRRYGATGLIQEFNDATRSGGRLALIKANALADPENPTGDVYQVLTDVFAHYGSVGVNTAGYPLTDTQTCSGVACTWQSFDRRYALFAYSTGANDPQNITLRDPYYARWETLGGISRLGPPVSAETATTGSLGGNATMQRFADGVLFNITSGTLSGRLVGVRAPIYALYLQRGGHTGTLGYPTGDEQVLANGRRRQTFEGGSIEYDDVTGPVLRPAVQSVTLRPSTTPVRLNVGEALSLEATVLGADGSQLMDRQINWITTNSRVASVQSGGAVAQIRAVGGGTARISATSEGRSSAAVEVIVAAQCCAVGEGAPTAAIQQAFLDAVTRNRIQVRVPAADRVRRSGAGYVQELQGSDTAAARYLIAMSDRSAQAFVISGAVLTRYEELGGPASFLGFPTQDASALGRQVFEGGALAGSPVRVVSAAILARWSASGWETGAAGLPTGEAVQVTSFTGTSGQVQTFARAVIAGTGRTAYLVLSPAAEYYSAADGPLGALGFPLSEESGSGALREQEFEGGSLRYDEGGTQIQAVTRERKPSVAAVPAAVVPGSRVRVTLAGFPDRSSLRVSVTGQADFVANAPGGSFSWEFVVPVTAAPGTVRVRAVDGAGNTAETSYTVRTLAEARVQLVKVSGDAQSGAPGAMLPNPLRIALRDEAGMPVSGATVRFTASPGAAVSADSAVTDAAGVAETRLRLPGADGIALVTAETARQAITFSARAVGTSITGFPRLMQTGSEAVGNGNASVADAGALLASTASIMRYYQARGELGSPNGPASVAALNEFLRRLCTTDSQGIQSCDGFLTGPAGGSVVNLARVGQFVGGGLDIVTERLEASGLASLVAAGHPVLLSLSVTSGPQRGTHYVVASGNSADGGLAIHDPDPVFARSTLGQYLSGFEAAGRTWVAELTGALRLLPRRSPLSGFLLQTSAPGLRVLSPAGECGFDFVFFDQPPRTAGGGAGTSRMRTCDGMASEYQIEIDGDGPVRATLLDLAEGGARTEIAGGGGAAFRVARSGGRLLAAPQTASLGTRSVLNSATYTEEIAPAGLISIFGSGLARSGRESRVTVGGRAAVVIAAMPFQVNAQVPPETPPGTHTLTIEAPWGRAEQTVPVRATAPAVFRSSGRGIVTNQDGTLNTVFNPARRGDTVVVYATGLGVVSGSGNVRPAVAPVTAHIREVEVRVSYAGLTPGFIGLYQINIVIPPTVAPGIEIPLTLRQQGDGAQPVEIAIF